ncbi:MAG: hypothetical protein IPG04_33700 [Polyangiaceae bacterium]|nr:hypothetical protein [Polyangiaceae bacterium]
MTTGAGRAVETFRAQSGVTLAHARFTYDPLGNLTHTRRAVSPELATTTWVEWRSEVDARGRALTTFEPGAVPVHSEYDSVGRLCRTWFDESVNGVVTRRETSARSTRWGVSPAPPRPGSAAASSWSSPPPS